MLNGLIGQANLEHARGRSREALTLLQEVFFIKLKIFLSKILGYSSSSSLC